MSRSSIATISSSALLHNFHCLKALAPSAKFWCVIKANAYGHGDVSVANFLAPHTDGFAVAHFEEAETLRASGIQMPIILLEGVRIQAQIQKLASLELTTVVSDLAHLNRLIEHLPESQQAHQPLKIWLKMNSGMNRLGVAAKDFASLVESIQLESKIQLEGLMTHFACADEPHSMNQEQLDTFDQYKPKSQFLESLANSAVLFTLPEAHRDWVRPGIALYGSSPIKGQTAEALGLKPVMSLTTQVISVKTLQSGDAVGYGADWVCDRLQKIAVLGIGYGDGYPRHVKGAQVWLKGQLCPIVGRVSMDMLTVLIPQGVEVQLGDVAECWGNHISVDEVAAQAGTISYELLCQVTSRVPRIYQ